MKRKNIALEEATHEKVTQLGKKNESYDSIIIGLLKEQPWADPLRLAYGNYLKAYEKARTFQTDNPTMRGTLNSKARSTLADLIRQVQHFFNHIEERSR